ncbi:MAG: hypothetical protein FJ029_02305 [Actinobacteria bacterium]|nr:hypothetical protein [Actinomycetota bacterium]
MVVAKETTGRFARRRVLAGAAVGAVAAALPAGVRALDQAAAPEARFDAVDTTIDTVILINYERMKSVGYSNSDVSALETRITSLIGFGYSTAQMKAKTINLNGPTTTVKNAQDAWYLQMGNKSKNNAAVTAFVDYVHAVIAASYPNAWRIIIVGTHEITPMWARGEDQYWPDASEKTWAAGKAAGWFTDLMETTNGDGGGHWFTDEMYANLQSYNDGQGTGDRRLIPEYAVGRLVETPAQIKALIDEYVRRRGTFQVTNRLSCGAYDFTDGGAAAADAMGSGVDDTLVDPSYASSSLVTRLNSKHDLVYLSGHGTHNRFVTECDASWNSNGSFYSGTDASQGDMKEVAGAGAVITCAGCHCGIS